MIEKYLFLLKSPCKSIARGIHWKVLLGIALTPLTSFLPDLEGSILTLPPTLLAIVAGLWLLDLMSGLVKTVRTSGFKGISSIGLRMTVIKFIEYSIFLLAVDLFSSTAQYAPWVGPALARVDEIGAIILAATEFRSIDENLRLEILEKMGNVAKLPAFLVGTKSKEYSPDEQTNNDES